MFCVSGNEVRVVFWHGHLVEDNIFRVNDFVRACNSSGFYTCVSTIASITNTIAFSENLNFGRRAPRNTQQESHRCTWEWNLDWIDGREFVPEPNRYVWPAVLKPKRLCQWQRMLSLLWLPCKSDLLINFVKRHFLDACIRGSLTLRLAVNAELMWGNCILAMKNGQKNPAETTGNTYEIEILMSRTRKLNGLSAASLRLKTLNDNP